MADALEAVKQKLTEYLAFAKVNEEDIDALVRVAQCLNCSVVYVSWRKENYWVTFKVIHNWDEDLDNEEDKLMTVKVRTRKQSVSSGLKHIEDDYQEYSAKLQLQEQNSKQNNSSFSRKNKILVKRNLRMNF
ncbi:MAG: hypothetical protein QXX08_10740 [Candidatus Bathyarchaeia archaeon]